VFVELGLSGRVSLVSGASSGLGLAIARALAAEGAHVALAARDRGRLEAAREEVDSLGSGLVSATVLDIRDIDAVHRWVDRTVVAMGALHVVVANAGGPPAGTATAVGLEDYREAVELCLLAPIGLVQSALPHLRAAGWGRIMFVTSEAVRQPIPTLALSNTARVGLLGYTKSLVADLGPGDITVNVLAPGWHRTRRVVDVLGGDFEAKAATIEAEIPLGRMGNPEDFGAIAAVLASVQASYITGAVIPVDGGHVQSLL
jgi:3-oxoacyl-[acyl-carrier protein] reductase